MYNVVIGLDISKTTIDASLIKWNAKSHLHDSFLNKPFGFNQLINWVKELVVKRDKILFCLEHTGHYAHHLIMFLKKKNYDYAEVNPLKIKRSMGLRREKSDKADSKVIGMFGLKFQEELNVGATLVDELLDLQLLLAHRKRLQEKQLSLQRQEKYLTHCLSTKMAKLIVRDIKKHKKYFDSPIKAVEYKIDQLIHLTPALKSNYHLLISIPGIGRIIVLYSIVYTRNFSEISDPRKYLLPLLTIFPFTK